MTGGERALAILTVAGLVIVPTIFLTGVYDYFRVIKEVAFRAEAILAVFLLGVAVAAGGTGRLRELVRDRAVVAVVTGSVFWTAITAVLSTNRLLSRESMITVVCSAALFIAVWYASRIVPVAALLVLVPVAAVNAAIAALQEYNIWDPFRFTVFEVSEHLSTTALLGNPNDVGAYFALCMIVLFGAASHLQRPALRALGFGGGVIALAGVFVSQTRTAAIAAGVALFVFAIRRSVKATVAILFLSATGLIVATRIEIPVLTRIVALRKYTAPRDWNFAASYRIVPFLAAVEMFRERPLTGEGPGTFRFHYMDSSIALAGKYPPELLEGRPEFFADAHNDHLQLLAETGVAGYVLFLAALVVLARPRKRDPALRTERTRTADTLGLPLTCGFFVVALAFFPLQIAVTRHLLITISALIVGWRDR